MRGWIEALSPLVYGAALTVIWAVSALIAAVTLGRSLHDALPVVVGGLVVGVFGGLAQARRHRD